MHFFDKLPTNADMKAEASQALSSEDVSSTGTCVEAETFALRVLDDSMQPEFRQGCIIIIDPTGRATDGSYVLAKQAGGSTDDPESYLFRQLQRVAQKANGEVNWQLAPLNNDYPVMDIQTDLSSIVGVIVQRAGVRRRYHKHYYQD